MAHTPTIELLDSIEKRERLFYCNKCQYFGATSQHKRPPGNQNDCQYMACESSDSQHLDRVSKELREALKRAEELEATIMRLTQEPYDEEASHDTISLCRNHHR